MLHLPVDIRVEVLYVVAHRHPLEVLLAKAIFRYFRRVLALVDGMGSSPVGVLGRWSRA